MFNTDSKCKHTIDRKMAINSSTKDNTSQSLSHSLFSMKHVKHNVCIQWNAYFLVAIENKNSLLFQFRKYIEECGGKTIKMLLMQMLCISCLLCVFSDETNITK